MFRRLLPSVPVIAAALCVAGCSGLTKPDDIRLVAGAGPTTAAGREAAAAPGAGGVARGSAATPGALGRAGASTAPGAAPGGG
jgi:hypothetical protein